LYQLHFSIILTSPLTTDKMELQPGSGLVPVLHGLFTIYSSEQADLFISHPSRNSFTSLFLSPMVILYLP